jgi:Tfp pilus assembly protein PilF
MSDRNSAALLEMAYRYAQQGNHDGAIHLLKQALSEDPDLAPAHAMLALCLRDTKRIYAAEVEANAALALDPDLPISHLAAGSVAAAQRKFDKAEGHYMRAMELDPEYTPALQALAGVRTALHMYSEAEVLLNRSLEIDPNDADALEALGSISLLRGDLASAQRWAEQALHAEPEHADSLILRGHVALRQGDIQAAREHAVWVLRNNPASIGALDLIASIKARTSKSLGLWWRWNVWMNSIGEARSIMVLVGAFVIYRVVSIAARSSSNTRLAEVVELLWLGIVVYTWFAPAIFMRLVSKEIKEVRLRDDF